MQGSTSGWGLDAGWQDDNVQTSCLTNVVSGITVDIWSIPSVWCTGSSEHKEYFLLMYRTDEGRWYYQTVQGDMYVIPEVEFFLLICKDLPDKSSLRQRRKLLESQWEMVRVLQKTPVFNSLHPYTDNEIVEFFSNSVKIPMTPSQDYIMSCWKWSWRATVPTQWMMNCEWIPISRLTIETI